jgi:hypothetical protein
VLVRERGAFVDGALVEGVILAQGRPHFHGILGIGFYPDGNISIRVEATGRSRIICGLLLLCALLVSSRRRCIAPGAAGTLCVSAGSQHQETNYSKANVYPVFHYLSFYLIV